jgi:hypothetical protein
MECQRCKATIKEGESYDMHGKITRDELLTILGIKPEQLEQEFAFFRHCELIRAFREDGKVYFTKW